MTAPPRVFAHLIPDDHQVCYVVVYVVRVDQMDAVAMPEHQGDWHVLCGSEALALSPSISIVDWSKLHHTFVENALLRLDVLTGWHPEIK